MAGLDVRLNMGLSRAGYKAEYEAEQGWVWV